MGIGPFRSHDDGFADSGYLSATGNPNPFRWHLIRWTALGPHLLVQLRYPDCKNYEGNKILLYKNLSIDDFSSHSGIDPHFSDKEVMSPFARFEPTDEGWFAGILLGNTLS